MAQGTERPPAGFLSRALLSRLFASLWLPRPTPSGSPTLSTHHANEVSLLLGERRPGVGSLGALGLRRTRLAYSEMLFGRGWLEYRGSEPVRVFCTARSLQSPSTPCLL